MAVNAVHSVVESIKAKARSLGFDLAGIARSRRLREYEEPFLEWCNSGMNGKMAYMLRNTTARFDPAMLIPGTRTVVVTGMNYYTCNLQESPGVPVISRYALGTDYHPVVINKLNELLRFVRLLLPGTTGKAFCDSSVILEKAWAVEAGLGWQGRNSLVINKSIGSFFFIGILLLDVELDYDIPDRTDLCGNCRLCEEKCPVGAIRGNRTVDAGKCISALTIEKKEPVSPEEAGKFRNRVFGCDICQEVCPWNKNAKPHEHPEFIISEELRTMNRKDWLSLDRQQYRRLFNNTPVSRVKFEIFKKNIQTILEAPGNQA